MAELSDKIINDQVSYGTFGYLNTFISKEAERCKWDLLLVNMMTLARNITSFLDPKLPIVSDQIHTYISKDIEMFVLYAKRYFETITANVAKPNSKFKIIFYYPEYSNLGSDNLYKQPTKAFRNTLQIYDILYKDLLATKPTYNKLYKKDNLIYYSALKPRIYPSISLFRLIKQYCSSSKRAALFTSIPMEYFLVRFFPKIHFVDSFTGKIIKHKQEISNKLFKSPAIPFNKYIHYLFGDKYLINSHLPHGYKTKLILQARNEKWVIQSETTIRDLLIKMNLINLSTFKYHPY